MSSGQQETPAVDSQDRRETLEAPTIWTKLSEERKVERNGVKSAADELLPWLFEFKNKCRCSLAQRSLDALIRLMEFYERNIVVNVSECYTKPYRAAKLKDSISETLLFFLFYYRELVEVFDRASYLDKMSDILAMYMDMELKASRRGKEHHGKIAARLASTLYIYLENSPEHILDTFMKARFVNRNYHDILDPLITKILKTTPPSPNSDVSYVRYLLIYRLWKRVNIDATVKNEINGTALSNLGPPPTNLAPFLAKHVLPKIPKSQSTNSTKFLLLHKFDIEKACRLLVQYCKVSREGNEQTNGDKINFTGSTANDDALEALGDNGIRRGPIRMENQTDNANVSGVERNRLSSLKGSSGNEQLSTRVEAAESSLAEERSGKNVEAKENNGSGMSMKPVKTLPRSKLRKSGEILFIDLTSEEVKEKVIKKKKRRKLEWLKQARKKLSEINATKRLKTARAVPKMPNSTSEPVSSPRLAASSPANETNPTTSLIDDPICVASKEQEIIGWKTDERTDNSGESSNICDNIRPSCDGDSAVDRSSKNSPVSLCVTLPLEIHDQEVPTIGAELVLGRDDDDDDDDAALVSDQDGIVAKIVDNSSESTNIQSEIPISDLSRVDSSTPERKIIEKDLKSARDLHDLVSRTNELNLDATSTMNATESIDSENKVKRRRSSSHTDPKSSSFDANRRDVAAMERFARKVTENPEKSNNRVSDKEATRSLESERGKLREGKSSARKKTTRKKSANRNAFSKDGSGKRKTSKVSSTSTRRADPRATEIVAKTYKPSDLLQHREVNFCENIDGLSLLASVSQHVLNLKDAEKKSASPGETPNEEDRRRRCSRKTFENSSITKDSCDLSAELDAIASSEMISEIVGVPPRLHRSSGSIPTSRIQASDTAAEKFSISGEGGEEEIESGVAESAMVRYAVGSGTIDENASQPTKESRNVILDGETVVLLKKSANSNVYIINKSLDSSASRFVGETVKASSLPTMADKSYEKYPSASKNTFNALRDIKNVVERRAGESKRGKRSLKSRGEITVNDYDARNNENQHDVDNFRTIDEPTSLVDVRRLEDQHEDTSLPESDGLSKSSRTETPESVIEMEPRKKTPPPMIRLTDTPFEDRAEQPIDRRDSPSKLGGSFAISNFSHEAGGERALWNSYAAKNSDRDRQTVGIKQEFVKSTDDDAFPEFYATRYDETFLDFETRSMRAAQILPPKIPPSYVYGATNLFAIQRGEFVRHPHVGCNLQVSTSQSRQNFQLPCPCLECGYDAHYRRQVQQVPAIITAAPCLQTNSFLVPTASPLVAACPMQDARNSKLDEIAIAKLSDDQLLRSIEQSTTNAGERGGTKRFDVVEARKYEPEVPDIKLPLKKRLKAHAMMALSFETPIKLEKMEKPEKLGKMEKMENYPGTPMMSIAALETPGDPGAMIEDSPQEQKCYAAIVEARIKDDHQPSSHHATSTTTEMIRRDYVKDTPSVGIVDEKTSTTRKAGEQQRKQPAALSHESNLQRTFKTPAQRKELFVPSPASLSIGVPLPKRPATSPARVKSAKKAKKTKSPAKPRQTRSSKRNIPKVNYSCSDADAEWTNPCDLTRKRKKTGR